MSDSFSASLTVPGRIQSIRPAAAFLVETARSLKVPAASNDLFEVAIVEAITNALEHNIREGETSICCEIELADRRLIIRVLDDAAPASLTLNIPSGGVPWNERPPDSIEDVPESGYGLYLMHEIFPDIRTVTRNGRRGVELGLVAWPPTES